MAVTVPPGVTDALNRQHGVITRRQLHALDCSDRTIATWLRRQYLLRIRAGGFVAADVWHRAPHTTRHCMQLYCIQLLAPDAIAWGPSAAIARGLPTRTVPPQPTVTRSPGRGRLAQARVIRSPIPDADFEIHAGLRVTSIPRTVVDIAASAELGDSLMTIDAALRRGVPECALEAQVEARQRVQGKNRARLAISCGNPASESPLESLSRGRMIERAMPVPLCNVVLRLGRRWVRVDHLWAEVGVVGECDGKGKYDVPDQAEAVLWKEKRRGEWIEDIGFELARWGFPEVADDGSLMEGRYRRAVERQRRWGFTWPAEVAIEVPRLPGASQPAAVVAEVSRLRQSGYPIVIG